MFDHTQKTLGQIIKYYRTVRLLSPADLAKAVNLREGTIRDIERGRIKKPPEARLEAIAKALGIPASLLRNKKAEGGSKFGSWLRSQREKKNMSRLEMATQIGVKAATVADIETGRIQKPGEYRCARIARALGVSYSNVIKQLVLAITLSTSIFAIQAISTDPEQLELFSSSTSIPSSMETSRLTSKDLSFRMGLTLEEKILLSQESIRKWFYYWNGMVYISYSGGKDSTVLRHLVRSTGPEFSKIPCVFANTGLEYPEVLKLVRSLEDVIIMKPKMRFSEVIERYGWPVVSKEQALYIGQVQRTKSPHMKRLRLDGVTKAGREGKRYTVSKKWRFLIDSPFKISSRCCHVLKIEPLLRYAKKTGRKAYHGTTVTESQARKRKYLKTGCNAFAQKTPLSTPLAFWTEEDVWEYIRLHNLPYASVYDKGEKRTGCVGCGFGLHLEDPKDNRLTRLKDMHPKFFSYIVDRLKMGEVLKFMDKNTEHDFSNIVDIT